MLPMKSCISLRDGARADKRGLWGLPEAQRVPRGGSGGNDDLEIHTCLSLVMYHLHGFAFNMTVMLSVRQAIRSIAIEWAFDRYPTDSIVLHE
jgi:hypothetical protein